MLKTKHVTYSVQASNFLCMLYQSWFWKFTEKKKAKVLFYINLDLIYTEQLQGTYGAWTMGQWKSEFD